MSVIKEKKMLTVGVTCCKPCLNSTCLAILLHEELSHVNLVIMMAQLTKYLLVAQWLESPTSIWEVMELNPSILRSL